MPGGSPTIGIDLGTTYSCAGAFLMGEVQILVNDQGNKTTPSYVAFTDHARFIGEAAKNYVTRDPQNTVFDAKRLIGRRYDDPKITQGMRHWQFGVLNDCGKPMIEVDFKGAKKRFYPEEISAMILTKMKEIAENSLGTAVNNAVITVPAYFNDSQRQATKDAGTIAGFNVLRIINEPTAAALAYGLDKHVKGERNVLIFDLGGGTFDVSILTIDECSVFEVQSTAGNTYLGGEDFDYRLVDYLCEEFRRKHGIDLRTNRRAMARLKTAVERAKRSLSSSTEASIEIDSLIEGIDFFTTVSRTRFEELCADLFLSTLLPVERALEYARMDKSEIHDVVLVGGSTRIPKIQSLLQNFFNGKPLNLAINPDEAVAYGAAIYAAILTGDNGAFIKDILLVDVTPLSLGIETGVDIMATVIERNTQIPCKRSRIFTTHEDNQPDVEIQIYEGERVLAKDNNLLGTFDLIGIPPAPRGVPQIKVTFDINADGILNVEAEDIGTGFSENVTIRNNKGRLSQAEINRMLAEAEQFKKEDEKLRQRVSIMNQMESYIFSTKQAVNEAGNKITEKEKIETQQCCDEYLQWLEGNPTAEKDELQLKFNELQIQCAVVMVKIHQDDPEGKFINIDHLKC